MSFVRKCALLLVAGSVIGGVACKKSKEAAEGITAIRAYAQATAVATQWDKNAQLVDAVSEDTINTFVEGAFTPEGHWVTTETTLRDPTVLQFEVQTRDADIGSRDRPVVLQWGFVFDSPNGKHLVVHVTADQAKADNGPLLMDVGKIPIVSWNIDSSKAVEMAREKTSPHRALQRRGSFRLKMWKVNGKWIPLWTVPLQLQNGQFFVVTADSGQMLFPSEEGLDGHWSTYDELYGGAH